MIITPLLRRFVAAIVVAAAFSTAPCAARADEQPAADQPADAGDLVTPRLITERRALVKGRLGEYLGVTFRIADGWRLYWQNPGDSGSPIDIKVTAPPGVEVGEVLWPTPKRIVAGEHLNYGYEERVTAIIPIRVSPDFQGGEAVIKADLSWVVCKEECVFGDAELDLTIPVLPQGAAAQNSPDMPLVWQGRYALPGPPPEGANVFYKTRWDDDALVITADGAAEMSFFPLAPADPLNMLEKGHAAGDTLRIEFDPVSLSPDKLPEQRVRGVVHLKRHTIEWRINVDVPVPARR